MTVGGSPHVTDEVHQASAEKLMRRCPISRGFLDLPPRGNPSGPGSAHASRATPGVRSDADAKALSRTEGAEQYLIDRGEGAPRPILQDASRPPDVREKPRCCGRSIQRLARSMRGESASSPEGRLRARKHSACRLAMTVGVLPDFPTQGDGLLTATRARRGRRGLAGIEVVPVHDRVEAQ